jgi:phage-related protein
MLAFLSNLYHIITGDLDAIKNWFLKTLQAIYSWIDRQLSLLWSGVVDAARAADNLFNEAWHYIATVYDYARAIVDVIIHNLIVWIDRIVNAVEQYAEDVYGQLVKWVDWLVHAISVAIDDVRSWIINDIWNPLYRDITSALNWILHWGAYILDLITHPEKLVKLLGHWLWISWIDLVKSYGRPIARWLMHTMLTLPRELADLIETVIASLL